MPWTIDAEGRPVWVEETPDRRAAALPQPADPNASTIIPELEQRAPGAPAERVVQLVDPTGQVYDVGESGVPTALESGRFKIATPEQVEHFDTSKQREGPLATLRAFGHAAARGVENTVGLPLELMARGVEAVGLAERQPEREDTLARVRREEQAALARDNPIANVLGNIAGTLPGGLAAGGVAGAGARALGAGRAVASGVAGAAEGATQGYTVAAEESYFENRELTAEQIISAMGWGALIGGGVGYGVSKGQDVLFSRIRSRGATPIDAPHLGATAREKDLESVASRMLGEDAAPGLGEKLRDVLSSGYSKGASVVAGADEATVAAYGAGNWSAGAKRGRDLYRRSGEILEGATSDITAQVDELNKASRSIFDEVVDVDLKRANVASKLTGNRDFMLAAAREEASRLREAAFALGTQVDTFGNRQLVKRIDEFTHRLAMQVDDAEDAADAFIALDRAKRGYQRWAQSLRAGARISPDALKRQQGLALGDEVAKLQEGTRQLLMNETVWGEAGKAQRTINAAWERFFESQQTYRNSFLTRLGRDFEGAEILAADPKKISSYVRSLGRQEGKLVDEQFRSHVAAVQNLSDAIGDAFDIGEKGAALERVRKAASTIGGTLKQADDTVKVVNQIDAVISAESGSGLSAGAGVLAGSVLGGPAGALAGAVVGAVARPGQAIRQIAALEALAKRVTRRVDKSLDGFLERALGPAASRLPPANMNALGPRRVGRALPAAAAALATPLALFLGKERDKQKAYKARVREVLDANAEFGARIRGRVEETFAGVSPQAPKLAASVATTATRGAQFLASKIPAPIVNARSLTPSRSLPVSDVEIDKFARYWSAVSNPVSALDDFRLGRLTPEQVEALGAVYPQLLQSIRVKVVERLGELDQKGAFVPYRARLQLDMLLGLQGAGEATASAQTITLFQQIRAAAPEGGQEPQPTPPARPINIASRLRSGRDALDPGGQQQ